MGLYGIAVTEGTYTFSWRIGRRSFHRTGRLSERPGQTVQVSVGPRAFQVL